MKDYNEMAESVFKRRDKYNAERRLRMNKFKKLTFGAVCCCLIALFGVGILDGNLFITEKTPGVEDFSENKLEAGKEMKDGDQSFDNEIEQNIEDVPADSNAEYNEAVNSSDLKQGTAAFYGGSYTNEQGKFVVVLTVDTAENRAAICKELGVSESTTIFENGKYTLAYLTELQSKISSAMTDKKIPFVTSSSVYETINRIKVRVTTDSEAELNKVLALDAIGGAIVFEHSSGTATKDLISIKE